MAAATEAPDGCSPTTGSAPAGARRGPVRGPRGPSDEPRAGRRRRASAARAATARSSSTRPPRTRLRRARAPARGGRALHARCPEERGMVDFGDPDVLVVVDPDRRLAERQARPDHHALSIAVADGPTMADVAFGYVYDLGPARSGARARRGRLPQRRAARRPDARAPPRRRALELVAVESADPRWLAAASDALVEVTRPRARDRLDRDLAVPGRRHARRRDGHAVEVPGGGRAAAQLIVRESGGVVAFTGDGEPLARRWTSSRAAPSSPRARPRRWRSSRVPSVEVLMLDCGLAERVADRSPAPPLPRAARGRRPAARRPRRAGRPRARGGHRLHRGCEPARPCRRWRPSTGRPGRGEPATMRSTLAPLVERMESAPARSPGRCAPRRGRAGGGDRRARRPHGPPRPRPVRARAARRRTRPCGCCSAPNLRDAAARAGGRPRRARHVGRRPRGHPRRPVHGGGVAAGAPRRRCCASCWARSTSTSTRPRCCACPSARTSPACGTRCATAAWSRRVAGPERRAVLDRVQATMALVEGHAEHVMDAAGARCCRRCRAALGARPPPPRAPAGHAPARAAAGPRPQAAPVRGGPALLRRGRAARAASRRSTAPGPPELLPTLAELEDPGAWLGERAFVSCPA